MTWRILNTGRRRGLFNMQFDEYLAVKLAEGIGVPTLRFFGWDPPAVSIGFNQRAEDFDLDKLRNDGIDLVRRPTGGRAILHDHELTYSVVLATGDRTVRELYRFISQGLLEGVRLLGVDAELVTCDDSPRKMYRGPESIPCFASSAKCEIQYRGRKVVGSAQRRFGRVILQHGSFLLGPEHRRIVDYLTGEARNSREAISEALSENTIDAEAVLGRPVTFEEAAASIRRGFETACGVSFHMSSSAVRAESLV